RKTKLDPHNHNVFVIYIIFFFQAEDGIRDRNVTGVQTCALPIWIRSTSIWRGSWAHGAGSSLSKSFCRRFRHMFLPASEPAFLFPSSAPLSENSSRRPKGSAISLDRKSVV